MFRSANLFHIQNHFAGAVDLAVVEFGQVTANHQSNHGVMTNFILSQVSSVFAIAKHSDAIGQFLHFPQPVGDVNDTDALSSQVVYHFKKSFGFGL